MNLDDIFDVGRQGSDEGGMWIYSDGLCMTCGGIATVGSWCAWHHPASPLTHPEDLTAKELAEALDQVFGQGRHDA